MAKRIIKINHTDKPTVVDGSKPAGLMTFLVEEPRPIIFYTSKELNDRIKDIIKKDYQKLLDK